MHTGDGLAIERVHASPLPALHSEWHVYDRAFPWNSFNPASTGRFAFRDGAHKMFYTASTPLGAFWETAGRFAEVSPSADGSGPKVVIVPPATLRNLAIVEVQRLAPASCLDLRHGHRAALVTQGGALDNAWATMLVDEHYERSHATTLRLADQVRATSLPVMSELEALAWSSRRLAGTTVYLHFDPPVGADFWQRVGDPLELDSPQGIDQLEAWYEEAGFVLMRKPSMGTPTE